MRSNSEAWYTANENMRTFNGLVAAWSTVSIQKQESLIFFGESQISN